MKLKKILKSLTKIALILLIFLVILLTGFYVALRSSKVQTWIAHVVTNQLSQQIGIPVSVGNVQIDFFNNVLIEDLYVEDLNQDTLAFLKRAEAKIDYFSFVEKRISLYAIDLNGFYLNVERSYEDSLFNIDAVRLKKEGLGNESAEVVENPWNISLSNVSVKETEIHFNDWYGGTQFNSNVDEIRLVLNAIQLDNKAVDIEQFDILCPHVAFSKTLANPNYTTQKVSPVINLPVQIQNKALRLIDGAFEWTAPKDSIEVQSGFDPRSIAMQSINFSANELLLASDSIFAQVDAFSFKEKSGLEVLELTNTVSLSNQKLELKDLVLTTANSKIESDFNFTYENLGSFGNFIDDVGLDVQMQASQIDPKDFNLFVDPNVFRLRYPINFQGEIYGRVRSFHSKDLKVRTGNSTLFEGDFSMNGLPDINETFISGKVSRFNTSYADLLSIYPKLPLPPNIDKLGRLFFQGKFDGFVNDFVTQGYLKSELGSIYTDLNFKLDEQKNAFYSGTFNLKEFQLGKYFGIENTLGKISVKGEGKGKGLKLNTLDVELAAVVEEIEFKGYSYENVILDGRVKDKFFNGNMSIDDENVTMNFQGEIDATQVKPKYTFDADIKRMDLKALNLWKDDLVVSAKLSADFSASNVNDVVGDIYMDSLIAESKGKIFDIGFFNISSRMLSKQEKVFTVDNKDFNATIQGNFEFAQIPKTFRSVLIPNEIQDVKNQLIKFELDIKDNPDLLSILLPDLKILRPSKISGNINSDTRSVLVVGSIPALQYKNFSAVDANINAFVDKGMFDVMASVPLLYNKDSLLIQDFSFLAEGPRDDLSLKLFADGAKNSSVELFANLVTRNQRAILEFKPSNIFINEQFWVIDEKNEVILGGRIISKDLTLYNGMSELSVDLDIGGEEQKADVFLSNIFLEDFTQFLLNKNIALKGVANGKISISLAENSPSFYGDLMVENIEVNDYKIGNLNTSAVLDLPSQKVLINGNLYGDDNEVDINGTYSFKKEISPNDFDITFDIKNFAIYSIEDFIAQYIDNTQGTVSGQLALKGPRNQPDLLGYLDINDVTTTVTYLQTTYNIKNERVLFEKNQINLGKKLKVTDIEGNIAYGKGRVYHSHLKDFGLDIEVQSSKVMGLNTTIEDNQDFYGKAYIKGGVTFKGLTNDITINVFGESEGKSELSIPLTDENAASAYEFYSFIEKQKEEDIDFLINSKDKFKVNGLTVKLDLDMDNDCKVKIILDQTTGDVLEVKGEGNVKITVPKEGDVLFYGQYVIGDGEYLFTLQNIINKRFRIEPNSNIYFQGPIEQTLVDVDAVYNLRAATKNLIEDYLATSTDEQLESEALNRVPVKLFLNLSGMLYNPDINFNIEIQQLNPIIRNYVDRKIFTLKQYENEMNRQVFGLLVLNQFLPPLTSIDQVSNTGFNINANDAANTVSEFVSNQLTRYFNDWISYLSDDVSLNFNYRNYEQDLTNLSSFEDLALRRELQLALTTKFLNDRVTINLGGNVDFGNNQLGIDNSNTTFFGGNASIEYALTENRRFRIKAFTNTDYDYFNQANTTRAGVGLSFKREFDNIKDLRINKDEFKLKTDKKDSVTDGED